MRVGIILLPTSPKSPLPLESLDSVLSVITLAANAEQLVGGSSAEFLEGEKLLELRSAVEGRVERTVFLAVHVDVSSFIHVRISLHHLLLLLGVVLHECEVVFSVVRNGSVQILAHGHASRLACYQLEVDTQLCVGVEIMIRHNCSLSGYSLRFDERGPPFRISQNRNRLRSSLAHA